MKTFFLSILLILIFCEIKADVLDNFVGNANTIYVIRLKNGDLLTGQLIDIIEDSGEMGSSIKFRTQIGTTTIYGSEIIEIIIKDDLNRHSHRAFIMPTAEPIGKNHFVGNYMIALFYAGFGIYDYVSVTAGRSVIPTVLRQDQISVLNVKATLYTLDWESMKGGMSIAIGGNLAFINDRNRFSHLFTNITFTGDRTDITGMVFMKTGQDELYEYRFAERVYNSFYANNSFGIGMGLTTKFSERHDLYFVGELWNTDIAKITNTGLIGAIRLQNSSFSADFGLMYFTPFTLIPVVNFIWTPF
ncbi:MAG: hypothetical protein KIT33_02205 [Candidatus Kapabacteria bacterium]|nr:hypothetical protein [Ignavibacteriota bacterium]MCW5883762.1 hypothetical protein [Candidatus Kapabacteria bacterium]